MRNAQIWILFRWIMLFVIFLFDSKFFFCLVQTQQKKLLFDFFLCSLFFVHVINKSLTVFIKTFSIFTLYILYTLCYRILHSFHFALFLKSSNGERELMDKLMFLFSTFNRFQKHAPCHVVTWNMFE